MWVVIPAYKEEDFIAAQVSQWMNRKFIDRISVFISARPWSCMNGEVNTYLSTEEDQTEEIVRSYFPQVEIDVHTWPCEHEMRNTVIYEGMEKKIDSIVFVDADEFYTEANWNAIAARSLNAQYGMRTKMFTYFWDLQYRVDPNDTWNPVVIVKPGAGDLFNIGRSPRAGLGAYDEMPGTVMHHLSWIGPISRLRTKILKHAHFNEMRQDWKDWFLNNDSLPSDLNFNYWPYPGYHKTLSVDPVPEEIVSLLKKWR